MKMSQGTVFSLKYILENKLEAKDSREKRKYLKDAIQFHKDHCFGKLKCAHKIPEGKNVFVCVCILMYSICASRSQRQMLEYYLNAIGCKLAQETSWLGLVVGQAQSPCSDHYVVLFQYVSAAPHSTSYFFIMLLCCLFSPFNLFLVVSTVDFLTSKVKYAWGSSPGK